VTALGEAERRLELLERMIRIREFEEGVRFLFLEGSMPGAIHQSQGQEATAVGVCAALRPDSASRRSKRTNHTFVVSARRTDPRPRERTRPRPGQ